MDFAPELDRVPRLRLHQDGRTVSLSPGLNEAEFRESLLLFEIDSPASIRVFFDDQPLSVVWFKDGCSGYGQLDLTNRVGFHRFLFQTAISEVSFDFRTTTAKATRDEIEAMARVVAGQVFSFKRQFVYADATGNRRAVSLPEVAFGWFRERIGEIVRVVRAIDARPATEATRRFITSHQARDASVPQTLRLLRENRGLLEALPGGPLEIENQQYWPAAVVVRERKREPARIEHMQLAHFLSRIAHLATYLHGVVPRDVVGTVAEWERMIRGARGTSIVKRHDVPNAHAAWTPLPTQLQKTEPRYRRVRELHTEFVQDIDVGGYSADAIRANIRDVWEIYQAFAAHMVGQSLCLQYVSRRGDLRERASAGFSMHSDQFELFYDCRVPPRVMSSWRDTTARPADERPDIVLRHRSSGAVAILDVKFKVDRDGASAKGEDLFEMQGYLNSFSLRAGAIIYPGTGSVSRFIDNRGMLLGEIPLRASFFASDSNSALCELKSAVEAVFRGPR